MTISLKPDLQEFVEEKVRSGQFSSSDEAVNALLSRVREQEAMTDEEIDELRADLEVGVREADSGEFVEFSAEDVIAERHAALQKKKK
jgi:antitoxin ParD1/3/4